MSGFPWRPVPSAGFSAPTRPGKTTLLKCINGILTPNSGRVYIGDRPVDSLSRQSAARLMAVVPQLTALAFSFTSLQMVVMGRVAGLGIFAKPCKRDVIEAEKILDELGLAAIRNRSFTELSGGERQMVLLARALFQEPQLLLLDEPTSHLDFKNQHAILETVRSITEARNLTTVVTLHDPNLAARYCTHMVMLKQGRIHRSGMTETVFEEEALTSMYDMNLSVAAGCSGHCVVMPSDNRTGPTWH